MGKVVVITCFGYPGSKKYSFDPEYVRSDLRRLLTYSLNKVRCSTDKIVVLTDMVPNPDIVNEIISEYQKAVLEYLNELGYNGKSSKTTNPSEWLIQTISKAASFLGFTSEELSKKISDRIIPVMRTDTILEFASLFTTFRVISGATDYHDQIQKHLEKIQSGDHFLFYYTGHGVRFVSNGKNHSLALAVQDRKSNCEYLKTDAVQELFDKIPRDITGLVVFDCCHASGVLSLPYSLKLGEHNKTIKTKVSWTPEMSKNPGIVFLASCGPDQTCGFYENNRSNKYGSLFTYYLMIALNKGRVNIRRIIKDIEELTSEYRKSHKKSAQNALVGLSNPDIEEIPTWT